MSSLRNFINRLAEPRLLRSFLQKLEVPIAADVRLDETTAALVAIEEGINNSARGTRGMLMSDIEKVEKLAT